MTKVRSYAETKRLADCLLSLVHDYIRSLKLKDKPTFFCHPNCRAVVHYMKELTLVDGWYIGLVVKTSTKGTLLHHVKACQHSWLLTPEKRVIDLLPVDLEKSGVVFKTIRHTKRVVKRPEYMPDPNVTAKISGPELEAKTNLLIEYIRLAVIAKKREIKAKASR
jgi:hypothetical protein